MTRALFGIRTLLVLSALLAVSGCSSSPQIASRWRATEVKVDGSNMEWENVPSYAEKDRFTLAVQHDDQFLYLCFTTQDRGTQMQMMGAGLIVWFDPQGGDKKVFGINFPLGRPGGGPPLTDDRGMRDPGREGEPGMMPGMPEQGMSMLDILGPQEGDRYRVSTSELSGIQVKIGRSQQNSTVYELKVPLKKSDAHPYALDARPGVPIGIRLVTPEVDRREPREGGERMGPPGGMEAPPGGMEGGQPGGMGGGRGGRGRSGSRPDYERGRQAPLDFWTKVTLAAPQK